MSQTETVENGTSLFHRLADAKQIPVEFLVKELGVRDKGTVIEIPYFDERRIERATRLRTAIKAGAGSKWQSGTKLRAYGEWRLDLARQLKQLPLVEGETDCWALWLHGKPALGIPGASNCKTIQAEHLAGISAVYLVREPGQSGDTFISGAVDRLTELKFSGVVYEIRMPDGVKDPADLHCRFPFTDDDEFHDAWLNVITEAVEIRLEVEKPKPCGYRFAPIDSAAFAAADYRPTWLVKRLLVSGQPCVAGGPQKSLKTSILMDLAISLGTGVPFLGEFTVYQPCRVAFISGESGQFTLQETAKRICAAKGVELQNANCLWDFRLPQLASIEHLAALQEGLQSFAVKVLMVDPLYLCLLFGVDSRLATNLFAMGPLLYGIAEKCLQAGCTLILIHHGSRQLGKHLDPMELTDLAFAGLPEFARQWILINRKEPFEPGSGIHNLWISAGGSAGQGGLWTLDVDEGILDESFQGRKWEARVETASEAQQRERDATQAERTDRQTRQQKEDDAALLNALDRLDRDRQGVKTNDARISAKLSKDRMTGAVLRLAAEQVIEETQILATIGSGARRPVPGIRRRRLCETI